MSGDSTSIWKKEISFRRKRKEEPAPAPAPQPPKPESVAALLRPLAEPTAPSLPPVSAPQAEVAPADDETAPPAAPEVVPPPPLPLDRPTAPAPIALPEPEPAPEVELEPEPVVEPEPSTEERRPSRSERRKLAKEEKREAKEAAEQAAAEAKEAEKRAEERAKAAKRLAAYKKQKKLVGLKIGGTHIAAARVVNNGVPRVLQVAEAPLDRGIVVSGEVREPEELASALKAFFRRHRLPRTGIRLGVASNRIGVRVFELAGIEDPKQLDNAIRFRAQETLPIPLDEAVLDYRVLAEDYNDAGVITRRVLLVVAHRELVDRYVAACRKAGLKLHGIDLEPFALLRALAPPEQERLEDAGVVVVAIGRDRSTLAVSDGEVCEYTRVLDWGGGALDAALARLLDISPPEAEPIKHLLSLSDADPLPEEMAPETAAALRAALRDELQTFTRDLLASLRYYQERPGSLGISEIVLTGGGSRMRGLAEEIERALGVRVRVGDPLGRVTPARKVRKSAPDGTLAAAIGLGIEE